MKLLQKLWNDESGQGLVEYGLLVILIVGVVVAALLLFGPSVANLFGGLESKINEQVPVTTP